MMTNDLAFAITQPAPAVPCCGRHPAAAFLNARLWPDLGLMIGECPSCNSTRTIGENQECQE